MGKKTLTYFDALTELGVFIRTDFFNVFLY